MQIVATATLGAVFGFGGLGRYLVDGVARNDVGQTWGGVILVAALAIATELGLHPDPARDDADRTAPRARDEHAAALPRQRSR